MILHVDMDAFYASVEQRDRPELHGRPVIVAGSPQDRGVVSAASYEARQYGVHSAMPASMARRLCPDAIFLPVRIDYYTEVSRQIQEILYRFTPLVEPVSLDEAYLDVRGCERLHGPAEGIGRRVKQTIREETRLVASVGVAPNKFLAKLASDLDKPDGFVVIPADRVQEFLEPLPVEWIWGVGQAAARALHRMGVQTIAQLRGLPQTVLMARFGQAGRILHELAQGRDDRPVVPDALAKSLSTETTFERDIRDSGVVRAWLLGQTEEVARRLRQEGYLARTVQIKVRYSDFQTITRARRLPDPTDVTQSLWHAVAELLQGRVPPSNKPIRLLGVGASGLLPRTSQQQTLFDQGKLRQLDAAVDRVHDRFGKRAMYRAGRLSKRRRGV